jgi:Flp pilus assembly pilin Flp
MKRRRTDEGAAAVEFALLLPILLLILFGIVDFSRLLNAQLNVTEAAREGARAASLGADDPEGRAEEVAGDLDVGVAIGSCPSPPGPDDFVDATVSHDFEFVTPIPGLSVLFGGSLGSAVTLTGEGRMPCLA